MTLRAAQSQVEQFHRKFGCTVGDGPTWDQAQALLRARLIQEEAGETIAALMSGNFVDTVDGLCDLIYVCLGTAVAKGVDLSPFFELVHASNMAKQGGGTREDGKILKPPGWQPPGISGELARQLAASMFREEERREFDAEHAVTTPAPIVLKGPR